MNLWRRVAYPAPTRPASPLGHFFTNNRSEAFLSRPFLERGVFAKRLLSAVGRSVDDYVVRRLFAVWLPPWLLSIDGLTQVYSLCAVPTTLTTQNYVWARDYNFRGETTARLGTAVRLSSVPAVNVLIPRLNLRVQPSTRISSGLPVSASCVPVAQCHVLTDHSSPNRVPPHLAFNLVIRHLVTLRTSQGISII